VDPITELFARPDAVLLDMQANSREGVVREMHAALRMKPEVLDGDRLLFDLLERLMASPVCVSSDAALPHARTAAVNRLMLVVGRMTSAGVAFDAEHGHIRLVFLIVVPKEQVDDYLDAMSGVTRILKNTAVRDGLLEVTTAGEFCAMLARGAKR
jgi:mannitol/fructose-specific phosphotransferase system IIA component (Ntr-type)